MGHRGLRVLLIRISFRANLHSACPRCSNVNDYHLFPEKSQLVHRRVAAKRQVEDRPLLYCQTIPSWKCRYANRRPGGLTLQAAALKGVQAVRLIFPLSVQTSVHLVAG